MITYVILFIIILSLNKIAFVPYTTIRQNILNKNKHILSQNTKYDTDAVFSRAYP